MKLVSTIFTGVLAVVTSMVGCNSEEDPSGTAGTSGAGATGGGGGGSGGRGGSAGSGATGGTGGSAGSSGSPADARSDGATQCRDDDPAELRECKRIGNEEGTCASLVECSCNKCACLLKRCQARPACLALRMCALTKRCCSPLLQACAPEGCCTGEQCALVCVTELSAAQTEMVDGVDSLALALELDGCVYADQEAGVACSACPAPDAGRDAGRDAAGGG
jgi:hypothetical protein